MWGKYFDLEAFMPRKKNEWGIKSTIVEKCIVKRIDISLELRIIADEGLWHCYCLRVISFKLN
jgi:hypothetical protein